MRVTSRGVRNTRYRASMASYVCATPRRHEHRCAGGRVDHSIGEPKTQRALEDVPCLVVRVMHM
jgi:hypothetical protein